MGGAMPLQSLLSDRTASIAWSQRVPRKWLSLLAVAHLPALSDGHNADSTHGKKGPSLRPQEVKR